MTEDFHDKTEEPTPKKLADAKKKGFVAKSNDLTIALMLLGSMALFFFFSSFMFGGLEQLTIAILKGINTPFDEIELISLYLNQGLYTLLVTFSPLIFITVAMALSFNIFQTGFVFSFYPLKPKWSKLNFFYLKNYEKNFALPAVMRMLLGLLRLNLVLVLSWTVVSSDILYFFNLGRGTPADIIAFAYRKMLIVGTSYSLAYIGVAGLDYMYQKWSFLREMRMSRREIKDEMKQMEGDQTVKNKIRGMMQTLSQDNLEQEIPLADVIITDCDKYTVAIAYDATRMQAPLCLCKESGYKGAKMVKIARQHHLLIIENSLLAKAISRSIEKGSYITPLFYHAIAEILMKLK